MTNVVSALTARTQFGQITKRATQKNERFVVGRRGAPSVVIMSVHDYMKTFAPA
jgi:prevent-host-death family protein